MAASVVPEAGMFGAQRELGAVLFMSAGMYTLDAYSTLNSSPWTAESFGGDPAKMKSLREYVCHAAVYSSVMCGAAAVLSRSWMPVLGSIANNVYLVWLYKRAAGRAQASGSLSWASGGKASPAVMLDWNNPG